MSEVSLLVRKQEKKMIEVLVKKTHFTYVEIERLFQIYRFAFVCFAVLVVSSVAAGGKYPK